MIKLNKFDGSSKLLELLEQQGTLRFTLFSKKLEILSKIAVEWRQVLTHRKLTLNIELPDFNEQKDTNSKSLGVLSIQLSVNGLNSTLNYLD